MSLLFGNLTQQFVNFTIVLEKAKAGDPQAIAGVPAAAASFRKVAAQDASYLVYIGAVWSPNSMSEFD
jgi:ATP-binding cassette subfamily B (MDR/TAP) protein 1